MVLTQIANKSWLYWEPRKIFHLLTPSFLLPWSHHSSLRHLVSSSLVFMTINYGFPPRLFDSSAVWCGSHVQMWELDHKEGRMLKNWCFRTLVLEKTLESLLDSKEINPEYSLEGLMLKLKLQYCGHLMWRADSLEKTLMLGKIEGRRRRGWQRMRWSDGITDSMGMGLDRL